MNAQRKRDSGQSAENAGRNAIPDKVQKMPEETRFRTRCRKRWKNVMEEYGRIKINAEAAG